MVASQEDHHLGAVLVDKTQMVGLVGCRNQALPFQQSHLVHHQAVEALQKLHLEVLDVEDGASYEAEFHDVHPLDLHQDHILEEIHRQSLMDEEEVQVSLPQQCDLLMVCCKLKKLLFSCAHGVV